jgi:hypothetical protein
MSTIYVFELKETKYYISEFKNELIDTIESMIEKLLSRKGNNYKQLLTQNLAVTLSSIEYITKYPIQTIHEIYENTSLEKVSISYMKKYGIDNVRSDLYKEIVLSDTDVKYINNLLNDSLEPVSKRIEIIDKKVKELKGVFNIIEQNNSVIEKYMNYNLFNNITNKLHELNQKTQIQLKNLQKQGLQQKNAKRMQYHEIEQVHIEINQQKLQFQSLQLQSLQLEINKVRQDIPNTVDTLSFNFFEICIKNKLKDYSKNIISIFEEHFLNHKLVEKIADALLLQKKNEKLISKYGTLEEINYKISNMLYNKLDLIRIHNDDEEYEESSSDEETTDTEKECIDL